MTRTKKMSVKISNLRTRENTLGWIQKYTWAPRKLSFVERHVGWSAWVRIVVCHVRHCADTMLKLTKKDGEDKEGGGSGSEKGSSGGRTKSASRALPNATDATMREILDVEYWRALVPFLHLGQIDRTKIERRNKGAGAGYSPLDKEQLRQQRRKIKDDGYCVAMRCSNTTASTENLDQQLVDKLAFAASVLEYYGWPTTFLAIYDEAWELAQQCQDWMDK